MKKKYVILSALMLVTVLALAIFLKKDNYKEDNKDSGSKEKTEEEEWQNKEVTYDEEGHFLIIRNMLYYVSGDGKSGTICCAKPECTHYYNLECDAYMDNNGCETYELTKAEDKIYYMKFDFNNEREEVYTNMYRMDYDCTNVEKLGTAATQSIVGTFSIGYNVVDGYVYFKDGFKKGASSWELKRVDLNMEEEVELIASSTAAVSRLNFAGSIGNKVYFSASNHNEKMERSVDLLCYDTESKTFEKLYTFDGWGSFKAGKGKIYFAETDSHIYTYKDGKLEVFIDIEEHPEWENRDYVRLEGEYIFMEITPDEGVGSTQIYTHDGEFVKEIPWEEDMGFWQTYTEDMIIANGDAEDAECKLYVYDLREMGDRFELVYKSNAVVRE